MLGLGSRAVVAASVLVAIGCAPSSLGLVEPDPAEFEAIVYPILLSDCGFPACHGDPHRFFVVYGPGRTRLSPATIEEDAPTPEELALSYTRASSMLVDPNGVEASPLLRRPLAVAAGGSAHGGDDPWGEPVYSGTDDPSWQAILEWARTAEPVR